MPWKKGQTGNPAGRPRIPEEVRLVMASNGGKAAERMKALLDDNDAWGKDGWLDAKDQIRLLESALTKAYGAQRSIAVEEEGDSVPMLPPPSQEVVAFGDVLRGVYEAMRSELPEFINAEPANAKDVSPDKRTDTKQ